MCENWGWGVLEWDSTTACYYGPCDWQHVGEKVIAEVCLWGRRPSGERMFSRLRHAEKHSQASYWWLISHTHSLLSVYFAHLQPKPWRWHRELLLCLWTVLKDFTCLDFSTRGLVRSRSSSDVKQSTELSDCKFLFTGLRTRVRHRFQFTDFTLCDGGTSVFCFTHVFTWMCFYLN